MLFRLGRLAVCLGTIPSLDAIDVGELFEIQPLVGRMLGLAIMTLRVLACLAIIEHITATPPAELVLVFPDSTSHAFLAISAVPGLLFLPLQ